MAAVVKFVRSKLGIKRQDRCVILGLDTSGKTTFLYKCKLGEIVTTIPTIGFNVETITVADSDITFWDVGGCDKIRPLVRHYFSPGVAILFMINIHDTDRFSEALEELSVHVTTVVNDFDASFVGIVFNKQDLPGTTPELRQKCRYGVESVMRGFKVNWRIFDTDGLSTVTGTGLDEILQGLQEGIVGRIPSVKPLTGFGHTPAPDVIPTTEDLQKKIQELRTTRRAIYSAPDVFLENMRSGKLEHWDHADHLYVASVILDKIFADPSQITTPQQPVFAAVDLFLEHLVDMLQAVPGKFRNTAHRTLTTFWVYQVYLAMQKFEEPNNGNPAKYWPERFFVLLERNPGLMNGGIWKEYYTKEYLFSPKAKDGLVTPDIQPLSLAGEKKSPKSIATGHYDMRQFEQDATSRRLKRWAYATLQTVKATNTRRGLAVKKALSELQRDIIRQRAKKPMVEPYSETQAYFWIQIVHAGMEGILKKNPKFEFSRVSFDTIQILYPDAFGEDSLWKEYYEESDWKGVKARLGFIPPRRGKVIPNFTPILELEQDWRRVVDEVQVPTMDELRQRAEFISNYEVKAEDATADKGSHSAKSIDVRSAHFHEDDDDDDWVDVPAITTKIAETKISESEKSSSEGPSSTEPTSPQSWQDHAKLVRSIFEKLPKFPSFINHSHISQISYGEINKSQAQLTKMAFWVRIIVEAYIDTYGPTLSPDETQETEKAGKGKEINLREFLSENVELCWEDLWMVYYNELTWKSVTADEMILGCDRKQMRSVRGWKDRKFEFS